GFMSSPSSLKLTIDRRAAPGCGRLASIGFAAADRGRAAGRRSSMARGPAVAGRCRGRHNKPRMARLQARWDGLRMKSPEITETPHFNPNFPGQYQSIRAVLLRGSRFARVSRRATGLACGMAPRWMIERVIEGASCGSAGDTGR